METIHLSIAAISNIRNLQGKNNIYSEQKKTFNRDNQIFDLCSERNGSNNIYGSATKRKNYLTFMRNDKDVRPFCLSNTTEKVNSEKMVPPLYKLPQKFLLPEITSRDSVLPSTVESEMSWKDETIIDKSCSIPNDSSTSTFLLKLEKTCKNTEDPMDSYNSTAYFGESNGNAFE